MEIILAFATACGIMALIIALNACVRINKIEKQLLNKDDDVRREE